MKKMVGFLFLLSLFSFSMQGSAQEESNHIPTRSQIKQTMMSAPLTKLDLLKKSVMNASSTNLNLNKQSRSNNVASEEDDDIFYEVEPNDSFKTANKVDMKYYLAGTLDDEDIDFFSVKVPKGGEYILLGATDDDSYLDLGFGLVDPYTEELIEPFGYEEDGSVTAFGYDLEAGMYYIVALDLVNAGFGEPYLMKLASLEEDTTAPNAPTVNQVDDNDTSVTGTAEADSSIIIKAGKTVLGKATTTSKGKYKGTIKKQKAGTSLSVYAVDAAGNTSSGKTVKVIDKTAPSVPTVNVVSDQSTSITGKAETNATVYAMVGSKQVGKATAKKGVYTIKTTKQKAGTSISVYAIDGAKNKSASKIIKVIDKTAPGIPTVNKITSKTVTATGKGEKGATIFIYNGSKKIGQGVVNSSGSFKVTIKAQKKGSTLKVYAQDKSGNKSKSKTIKVN